jgi:hypothetical protein
MGQPAGGPVLGFARSSVAPWGASPWVGSARTALGCFGRRRPERTPCPRALMGPAARSAGLGRAQERGAGRAGGAILVGAIRASATTSHGGATTSASYIRAPGDGLRPDRWAFVVAARRAGGPPEVP